jgi:hypothetical protein
MVGLAADASSDAGRALSAVGVEIASAAAGITQVQRGEAVAQADQLDVVLTRLAAIERRLDAGNR